MQPVSDVERITVTGTRDFFSNSGANSVFGEDAIQNMPTFDRDLKDIVRSNPLAVVSPDASELGVAGTNPEYNALTVDGVGINDTFGLQDNGYPQQILFDYGLNDQGQYVLTTPYGGSDTRDYDEFDVSESTWRIKVGVKYTF